MNLAEFVFRVLRLTATIGGRALTRATTCSARELMKSSNNRKKRGKKEIMVAINF